MRDHLGRYLRFCLLLGRSVLAKIQPERKHTRHGPIYVFDTKSQAERIVLAYFEP